jgi:hypothetical protein
MSETHINRSLEVAKCETPNHEIGTSLEVLDTGISATREMEMSETHINRSLEVMKCETPKS